MTIPKIIWNLKLEVCAMAQGAGGSSLRAQLVKSWIEVNAAGSPRNFSLKCRNLRVTARLFFDRRPPRARSAELPFPDRLSVPLSSTPLPLPPPPFPSLFQFMKT